MSAAHAPTIERIPATMAMYHPDSALFRKLIPATGRMSLSASIETSIGMANRMNEKMKVIIIMGHIGRLVFFRIWEMNIDRPRKNMLTMGRSHTSGWGLSNSTSLVKVYPKNVLD